MMKTSLRMSVVAGLAAFLVSFGATAAEKTFNIGGDLEYDPTTAKITFTDGGATNAGSVSQRRTWEGGRVQIKAKARIDNDHGSFVEAVAAPRFNWASGTNTAAGDQYIMFGRKAWDVKLGRFEAIDLFPLGKDHAFERASDAVGDGWFTNPNGGTATTPFTQGGLGYQANKVRGRDSSDRIQGAAHFNFNKSNQLELGAAFGQNGGTKVTGLRPVYKFDAGRFRVGVGYDWLDCKANSNVTNAGTNGSNCSTATGAALTTATPLIANTTNTSRIKTEGFGITVGTKVGMVDGNFNIAQGKSKTTTIDTTGASSTSTGKKMTSVGINGTVRGFGLGYVYDKTQDTGKQDTIYGAYTVPLMGSKDATVTFAAEHSKAKYDNGDRIKAQALKARFAYAF